MRKLNFRESRGSAVLEFVAFILVGQVLVLVTSITLAGDISTKVELQFVAADIARQIALGVNPTTPEGVEISADLCSSSALCLNVSKAGHTQAAVSF